MVFNSRKRASKEKDPVSCRIREARKVRDKTIKTHVHTIKANRCLPKSENRREKWKTNSLVNSLSCPVLPTSPRSVSLYARSNTKAPSSPHNTPPHHLPRYPYTAVVALQSPSAAARVERKHSGVAVAVGNMLAVVGRAAFGRLKSEDQRGERRIEGGKRKMSGWNESAEILKATSEPVYVRRPL